MSPPAQSCFATPNAVFGYTEAKIGFVPALVMVYLQQRVSGHQLRKWLITAQPISAEEALAAGLIDFIVKEGIDAVVEEFALNLLSQTSADSRAIIKTMLWQLPGMSMNQALDYAAKMNAKARSTKDCIRGIDAFINKEKITW